MKLFYSLLYLFLLNATQYWSSVYASDHVLLILNFCTFPIWPGVVSNNGSKLLDDGGFRLTETLGHVLKVPTRWTGQIWARTNCDEKGHCQTGDCGGKIECGGNGPIGPVTVAHFSFDDSHDKDIYEVNLENGYNLQIQIRPVAHFQRTTHDYYDCAQAGCKNDLNVYCPSELQMLNSTNHVVACKSPCQAFDTDMFCCRGQYAELERCKTADLSAYYGAFKNSCPDAKNNVFESNTFWCTRDKESTYYYVTFCPK